MAQWAKTVVAKTDNLSLIPRAHIEEGENATGMHPTHKVNKQMNRIKPFYSCCHSYLYFPTKDKRPEKNMSQKLLRNLKPLWQQTFKRKGTQSAVLL